MLRAAVGAVALAGSVSLANGKRRPGLDIAWMPQRPRLPEEMPVLDYVLLGRTPHLGLVAGESKHDLDAVRAALAKLDLVDLADRPLGTLSGGEAQRAVLARALAQEAPILLLDEPTASLDLGHAVEVLEVVDQLRKSESLTVVSALHDLTLAARYADRLVLLSGGEIAAEGLPAEVLTEHILGHHYGSMVRVLPSLDGPIIVPARPTGGNGPVAPLS
jgi:iron complex transport system ATP-binding protein